MSSRSHPPSSGRRDGPPREYFQNDRAGLDREMAEILPDHLDVTIGRVIEIAKEIDNEYASPSES